MAYTVLLDVNVLLGDHSVVGRAIGVGQILPIWIEHAVTNMIAVVIAHIFVARAQEAGRRQAHGGMAAGGCGDFDRADRDRRGAHRRLVVGRTSWRENAQKQRM